MPHTATYKGKRVLVKLKDGKLFVDKFENKKSRFVYFQSIGKIPVAEIKSFTIYKPGPKLKEELEELEKQDQKSEKN